VSYFIFMGYINGEKVIPDEYNRFRYDNHELVHVYLCIRIKLYVHDYFIVFCMLE
jgi:hypothetical protein